MKFFCYENISGLSSAEAVFAVCVITVGDYVNLEHNANYKRVQMGGFGDVASIYI